MKKYKAIITKGMVWDYDVYAIQFDGTEESVSNIIDNFKVKDVYRRSVDHKPARLIVRAFVGDMPVDKGCYILKIRTGGVFVFKPEVFESQFEEDTN